MGCKCIDCQRDISQGELCQWCRAVRAVAFGVASQEQIEMLQKDYRDEKELPRNVEEKLS